MSWQPVVGANCIHFGLRSQLDALLLPGCSVPLGLIHRNYNLIPSRQQYDTLKRFVRTLFTRRRAHSIDSSLFNFNWLGQIFGRHYEEGETFRVDINKRKETMLNSRIQCLATLKFHRRKSRSSRFAFSESLVIAVVRRQSFLAQRRKRSPPSSSLPPSSCLVSRLPTPYAVTRHCLPR